MSLPADYFAQMYAGSPDPWGFRSRWYEQRKRAVTLAALQQPRYRRGFEPGCSIGVLTADLAQRCDSLVASDVDATALRAAREAVSALSGMAGVELVSLSVPEQWPAGTFDLVVVSELAYYLSPAALDLLVARIVTSLEPGGTLLACHWRHPVADYPATGDQVHERLLAEPGLVGTAAHLETDFRIDVFSAGPTGSPAQRDGLVG